MARMIPSYCAESAPPGERDLFAALASDAATEDWTVLHSLGIARHVRQVEGEADFVVIVPNHGVLVIEVKSHQSVAVLADGRWRLGNNPATARGPVKQADEAMHSIREYLAKNQVNIHGVPIVCAAWFTHTRARAHIPSSPEWLDWQILDSVDLERGAASAILRTLRDGSAHLDSVLHVFHGDLGPDQNQTDRIASALRPRFEFATTFGDRRRSREGELIRFIDEQYLALDAMADNRAVLFTGPAGTGKTLLASEAARREALQGRTGRLMCFNAYLGRQLKDSFAESDGVVAGTFHAQLLDIAGLKSAPADAGPDFWDGELVDSALEAMLEWDDDKRADFVVIDEAQDLAKPAVFDAIDLLLKDGVAGGRLLLFGDFDRQAIYDLEDNRPLLRERVGDLTTYALKVNCRNLPRIAHATETFNVFPGYQGYRRHDDGVAPTFVRFERGRDQSDKLAGAIRSLREEGYELSEIAVLSTRRADSVAARSTDAWLRQILVPADGRRRQAGKVVYSTIHAFKGLEAPAVVLTDLDRDGAAPFEALLYVGITRATDRLVALIETSTMRLLLGGAA
ncbi:NERD domain-containing protein [Microbacterium lacticum]|uniref:nuclease-related domain-containing DEAD/DEAH box helicase n=1 Tax=Microbacterium lacticum TaxID=33885 RepID=UPI0028D1A252|nr:NERD domain-containing protein [Microbacterium lacticum]